MGRRKICELNDRDFEFAFAEIRDEIYNLYQLTQNHDVESIVFSIEYDGEDVYLITEENDKPEVNEDNVVVTNVIRETDSEEMIVKDMPRYIVEVIQRQSECPDSIKEFDEYSDEKIKEIIQRVSDSINE